MSLAYYRKYRSKSLDELVGQEHIVKTLKNSVKNGTFGHAYLFTGPRGVGKTSVARILACLVNDIDYDKAGTSLDIIEIDAASNRRIDEVRDLRDRVNIAPSELKYKVYIIDEVHMLTNEAFNALLKTLEEPPAHVIFILATTEQHKLPATIISRTQHFNFRSIQTSESVKHLRFIADNEKINIDDKALETISLASQGSFRDAINLLQQVSSNHTSKITDDLVRRSLGIISDELVESTISALSSYDHEMIRSILDKIKQESINVTRLNKQLIDKLIKSNDTSYLELARELIQINESKSQDELFEITLLEFCIKNSQNQTSEKNSNSKKLNDEVPVARKEFISKVEQTSESTESEPETSTRKKNPILSETKNTDHSQPSQPWEKILASLKTRHNTIYSVARMASTETHDDEIQLTFKFPFHFKKMNDEKSLGLLRDTAIEVTGKEIKFSCHLAEKTAEVPNNNYQNLSNIFGEVEVLES